MTSGGAGIPLIDLPIGDAVEGHRRSTSKDHAEQDQAEQSPPRKTSRGTRRDHHRPKGKRQSEYRVRKPDEGEKTGEEAQSFLIGNSGTQ